MKEVFHPRSGKSFRERAGKKNRMNGQISLPPLLLLPLVGGEENRGNSVERRWKDGKDEVGAREWTEGGGGRMKR